LVKQYGEELIDLLTEGIPADDICYAMKFCDNPRCRLFYPTKDYSNNVALKKFAKKVANNQFASLSPWDWLKELIDKLANKHEPIEDIDNDSFSRINTLRGSHWRGKDCNDLVKSMYPGRKPDPKLLSNLDTNCNGIFGEDARGLRFEDKFCTGTKQIGIAVIGDSAGAHFSIPPQYLTAKLINNDTYKDLLTVLEDELDLPHKSSYTGFVESTPQIPVDSLYLRLRDRNHCNHRDYQNCGVNGARSGAMIDLVKFLKRDNSSDQPILVIFEVIGNDVCSGHPDLGRMTTPEKFKENVLKSLDNLNAILPKGSHVLFQGLADGRVLWDSLHNRIHPIGVPYNQVYSYLNCLEISPCWGWMNENETVRNYTSARAAQLSLVYNDIISGHKYLNFDMDYYPYPFAEVEDIWHKRGGETWQLIEACDGFHPNQIANSIQAQILWDKLVKDHADWIGPVNPHNSEIQKQFGDQGGH